MKAQERKSLLKWVNSLTDEQLESAYYQAVFDSLGTQTEAMYELGYDMADIKERAEFEKMLDERADFLESVCVTRGIKIWEHNSEKENEKRKGE